MAKRDSRGNPILKRERFFALQHHLINSAAWSSLRPQEVAVFIRVAARFNGANNGRLALSVRDAAKESRISKDTAGKSLTVLCEKGLLKLITPGGFSTNGGKATEYALTCEPITKGKPASREYQNWKPQVKNKSQSYIKDSAVLNEGIKPKLRIEK